MNWIVRILLVGILATAMVSLLAMAISFAAHYIATIIIVFVIGRWLYSKIDLPDPS